eukprot:SAG22_NODE_2369_length_2651_cov_8.167712_2_plen_114_part_00
MSRKLVTTHARRRAHSTVRHFGAPVLSGDTVNHTSFLFWACGPAGSSLRPEWGKLVGIELYAHPAGNASSCDGAVNACFDDYENLNLAPTEPAVAKQLSAKLHAIVAAQFGES